MFTIIIQILAFQLCFLIAYELLFKKETFFNWNRAYLLVTSVVSLILPFIKIKSFSKVIPNEYIIALPTVVLGEKGQSSSGLIQHLSAVTIESDSGFSIVSLWYVGVLFFTSVLLFKLFKILRYRKLNTTVSTHDYSITILKNSEEAFSFLNTIFLGDSLESSQKESILKHEKVHVKEKHTLDLLWFELMRIVLWFNPLVYIYQNRITEVHEFIADKSASKYQQNYYENLLAKTFNIAQFSVVNQFYSSSLIKKRIIMLTKEKSNKAKLVKYITIIPIVLIMLGYVSCTDSLDVGNNTEISINSETTVMEDVITIVNKSTYINDVKKDITENEFNIIIENLKQYKQDYSSKINKTNFNEYGSIWYYLYGEKEVDGMTGEEKNKDLFYFFTANLFTEELLKEVNIATYEGYGIENIKLLIRPNMVNRLKELHYIFPNKEKYIKAIKNIENKDYSGQSEVSFRILDQAPVFPGCDENATLEELKKCFSRSIAHHVNDNFNVDLANTLDLKGKQKILVAFKVDQQGKIIALRARAPHEALKNEAIRVLGSLPLLKPGMHNGKPVIVPYSLPIIFAVN